MKIEGKVHCFFEQSGTFKNEFIKLGIPAEDYDIQNSFGETDHVIDLFGEIKQAYEGNATIFDNIGEADLIIAFFPCIYFCASSALAMTYDYFNYRSLSTKEATDKIIERSQNRQYFYELIIKLVAVAKIKKLRLIIENPYSQFHYLFAGMNFTLNPSVIDNDRTRRGDFYKKPTMYYFLNCKPTYGFTFQQDKERKSVEDAKRGRSNGLCSTERSAISPDYARNFICDFVIGKEQCAKPRDLFSDIQLQQTI